MPSAGNLYDYSYDRELAARRRGWQAHYEAKGCSPHKAWALARKKRTAAPPH